MVKGKHIRDYRQAAGLKLKEVAVEAKRSVSWLSELELSETVELQDTVAVLDAMGKARNKARRAEEKAGRVLTAAVTKAGGVITCPFTGFSA